MRIYHVERDHNLTMKEQKKQIKERFQNVTEIICTMNRGIRMLIVFAD